jgi:hypothetical protein
MGLLDTLSITRTERWNVDQPVDSQPKVWTAIHFGGDESQADLVTERVSRSLKPRGWYASISTRYDILVILPNKVFRYTRGDRLRKTVAMKYGRSLGIPDEQLDWEE